MPSRKSLLPGKMTAGDVDYEEFGQGYANMRRPDPRIAAYIHQALGNATTVLNVGAGTGSYEPADRELIPIEPSAAMRSQRPEHLAPAIDAVAEKLPLADQSVDADMAILTVHQWRDLNAGLLELGRVTRGPIVILTLDGDAFDSFWLHHYAPDLIDHESRRMPAIEELIDALGTNVEIQSIPIPSDCTDGFNEAYYAPPEAFLDPAVRRSQSAWSFLSEGEIDQFVRRLDSELKSGEWDRKFGHWRSKPNFEGSLRLLVSHPDGRQ